MKSLIKNSLFILFLCILCLSGLCIEETDSSEGAPMDKTEQESLYTAIQGFVGNSWNGSDLYPDPCGWTPIQGVSCDIFDGLWYVTSISIGPIHENSLDCVSNVEFRQQLFELKHLKSLSFFKCFISPHEHPIALPTAKWSKFKTRLESLEFRSNPGLIGEIPTSFGNLLNLESMVLLENGFTGRLPESFGNLTSLKRLVISGNWFTGPIPDSFGLLDKLLILDLSRNLLNGPLPLTIKGLTSLLKLDLSNNDLEGQVPQGFGSLKNLTLLDIGNNKFSGGLTKSIEEMSSLQHMVLSRNSIGGTLMRINWGKMKSLEVVDLSNMGLVGEIPESFSELKKLRFLGLGDNNLTGNVSPKLAKLPCVGSIYISGNNITGELKFSQEFYSKMGRRFGAWNNPNLCYLVDGSLSTTTSYVPYGVKPCLQQLQQISLNSKLDDDKFITSLGSSSQTIDGFFWVFLLLMHTLFNLLI